MATKSWLKFKAKKAFVYYSSLSFPPPHSNKTHAYKSNWNLSLPWNLSWPAGGMLTGPLWIPNSYSLCHWAHSYPSSSLRLPWQGYFQMGFNSSSGTFPHCSPPQPHIELMPLANFTANPHSFVDISVTTPSPQSIFKLLKLRDFWLSLCSGVHLGGYTPSKEDPPSPANFYHPHIPPPGDYNQRGIAGSWKALASNLASCLQSGTIQLVWVHN